MRLKEEKMKFKVLEDITNKQNNVRKWCLLYSAEKTVRSSTGEDKKRRKNQLDEYTRSIMPSFNYSTDFKKLNLNWWLDEIKWCKKHSNNYKHKQIALYRLLTTFFLNYNSCPFRTEKKNLDNKEFSIENQKIFKKFINQSIKSISNTKTLRSIHDIVPLLKKVKNININEEIYSASYKLHGKDRSIAKGVVIGGGTGVVTSIFLGPVIGGYIGNLAGFSGAAATSYGLALLGGGSLAAGGFGMVGGSTLIGLGFGISNGARHIKKGFIDEFNTIQAQTQLPLLLAAGRILFENGNSEIPTLIHKTISKKLKELNQRYEQLEKKQLRSDNQKIEKNLKLNKKSIRLYEKAKDMSETYNWVSGYEIYREVKSWAS